MDEVHTPGEESLIGEEPLLPKNLKSGKRAKLPTQSDTSLVDIAPSIETPVELELEAAEVEEAVSEVDSSADQKPSDSGVGLSADEWLSLCRVQLGVKPWILRAAVADEDSARKYTEGEIRSLIQRKLSEPA